MTTIDTIDDKAKTALSDTIANQLDSNTKEQSVFKSIKGKFFERKGHVPMKAEGYKVANALNDTLSTFAQKASASKSGSIQI